MWIRGREQRGQGWCGGWRVINSDWKEGPWHNKLRVSFSIGEKHGNEEMEVSDHLRNRDGNQVWDLKEHVRPEGAKEGKRSKIGEQGSKMRNRLQGSKMRNQSSCTSSEWGPVLHDTLPESHMCVATMTSF